MSELYRLSDRRLLAKLVPIFLDRGVSRSQRGGPPTAVISDFYTGDAIFLSSTSEAELDPVPDPLLLRKCSSAGNRTQTSETVARIYDH
jgi:hypothetical protein